jgi:uncharacterized Fe-S cluster-containing protein
MSSARDRLLRLTGQNLVDHACSNADCARAVSTSIASCLHRWKAFPGVRGYRTSGNYSDRLPQILSNYAGSKQVRISGKRHRRQIPFCTVRNEHVESMHVVIFVSSKHLALHD